MEFNDVMKALKINDIHLSWSKNWAASQAVYRKNSVYFLEEEFINEANKIFRLPDDAVKALYRVASIARNREELSRLAWHGHYILFINNDGDQKVIWQNWPSMENSMGESAGMFAVLVFISALPIVEKFYNEKGIPREVLIDTFSDVEIWMSNYYETHGVWGMDEMCWLIHHFNCAIYRLGRLQFMPGNFNGKVKVLRNKVSGKVVTLTEAGSRFRSDGRVEGINSIVDDDGAWISGMDEKDGFITGNPILPDGIVSGNTISLSLKEWVVVLSNGDPILHIHIPRGSRMPYELCHESLKMAVDFFQRYFPEKPFYGFALNTWFLDAQLQNLLPTFSNLVKFQMEFYIYRVVDDDGLIRRFVFKGCRLNSPTAPKESLLQRAILNHVTAGNHMYTCAGFILKEDMDRWGTDFYQTESKAVIMKK